MLPVLTQISSEQEQHSVLQLLAEGCMYLKTEDISGCLPFLYAFLLVSLRYIRKTIHYNLLLLEVILMNLK